MEENLLKLVLAEKPSVAQSISNVLGANERKDGYLQGSGYIVSWCFGHLIEPAPVHAYDEKYKKWRYGDLPIIPAEWKYIAAPGKEKQLDILRRLLNGKEVDTVICATDAGREGELIFRLVYGYCGCTKPVKRLWISSMEESAIAEGFENLRDGKEYDSLYQSALCRSHADYIVGINATRLFSVLYGETLNVGRVQSPTLALLAERDKEIAAFVKEPYYMVGLSCGNLTVSGEKMKDKDAAEGIRAVCDGGSAAIQSVERQEKSTACPKLYDLTTLQREANRLFGYTAQQTLDYVQALYEKKLATYPRTDSRYLTEDMAEGLSSLIPSVAAALPFAGNFPVCLNTGQIINNAKVTDHHAVIPTPTMPKTDLSSLPAGEKNILYMLAVRLICAVHEKHVYAETTVTLDCGGHSFTAKGKTVIHEGWKALEQAFKSVLKEKPVEETEKDKNLPEVAKGQTFEQVSAGLREGFTSPPKPYTEDTLLSAMECAGAKDMPEDAERKGLGTPATRAGIIEKIVKTGCAERKGRQLRSTQKGVNLIAVLPETVKSPMLTASWEEQLKQVERGGLSSGAFMDGITEMTAGLVKDNSASNPEYASLFGSPVQQGEVLGSCPRCGGSVREGKKGFFCEKRCGFVLWKDNRFFTAKKKQLDKKTAAALLKEGRVFLSGLYSEKTGKTYDATVVLDDTGGKWVNFKLEFAANKKYKGK